MAHPLILHTQHMLLSGRHLDQELYKNGPLYFGLVVSAGEEALVGLIELLASWIRIPPLVTTSSGAHGLLGGRNPPPPLLLNHIFLLVPLVSYPDLALLDFQLLLGPLAPGVPPFLLIL